MASGIERHGHTANPAAASFPSEIGAMKGSFEIHAPSNNASDTPTGRSTSSRSLRDSSQRTPRHRPWWYIRMGPCTSRTPCPHAPRKRTASAYLVWLAGARGLSKAAALLFGSCSVHGLDAISCVILLWFAQERVFCAIHGQHLFAT